MKFLVLLLKWFKFAPPIEASETAHPLEAQTAERTTTPVFEQMASGHDSVSCFAYDKDLLDRARQHWQFGEWARLSDLTEHNLEQHPERAKLALLAAAGLSQSGRTEDSRLWLKHAQKWGCTPKLIRQIMVAGVQTSLAQAALFAGDQSRASRLMDASVQTGMPHLEPRLLAQARLSIQRERLATAQNSFANPLEFDESSARRLLNQITVPQLHVLNKPRVVAEFNLGQAWSANTVNTVIFRHHGLLTHDGLQFTAFYVDQQTLRFVCRRLADNDISQYDLKGEYNLHDAHNSISLGVDRAGYLHACFDHHASRLRYRRSLNPHRIDGWTEDKAMTGHHEEKVTYPTFILPRGEYPLTLLYRDGTHNRGSARLKYYDESSCIWKDKPTPILSGMDQKPWTSNAYWNHPAIGTDGSLHLSFVWRTGVLGEDQLVNNINIGYAWSADNGHHWFTLQGQPYQVPITPATAETIWPIPPGSNLINQCGMALDRFNRPHIVFYANDTDGIPQYQHIWFDGKSWRKKILSQRNEKFQLKGNGTLQIPISRPDIVLDQKDNAYVIYRGDLTGNQMTVQILYAPNYETDQSKVYVLYPEDLGYGEPVIDRTIWHAQQRLTLLLQRNQQTVGDAVPETEKSEVRLVEIDFES